MEVNGTTQSILLIIGYHDPSVLVRVFYHMQRRDQELADRAYRTDRVERAIRHTML